MGVGVGGRWWEKQEVGLGEVEMGFLEAFLE